MNQNGALKLNPIVTGEQKLEVSLENDTAVIKLSTWTEGLGWCGQKTLGVDTAMLDDLHRAIAAARHKVNREAHDESNSQNSKVLEFPNFS